MIRTSAAVGLLFCIGCTPEVPHSENVSGASSAVSSASQNEKSRVAIAPTSFCEFSLGSKAPETLLPLTTRTVPTEGEERTVYDYRACGGAVPITVELNDGAVSSIVIMGAGNCLEGSICVGDSYAQAKRRFPDAELFLSLEEGETFSLPAQPGLTLVFPADVLPDECFLRSDNCKEQIQSSRIESIYLYTPSS